MTETFRYRKNFFYGYRQRDTFTTKDRTTVDYLLKQMYTMARLCDELGTKNAAPTLNAAYYVAVCLWNMDNIDETAPWEEIQTAISHTQSESFRDHHSVYWPECSLEDFLIVEWMAYAILRTQRHVTDEMEWFLGRFRYQIVDGMTHEGHPVTALPDFSEMIHGWEYSYDTDLSPRPASPSCFTEGDWNTINALRSLKDWELLLTFYQGKERQLSALELMRAKQPDSLEPVYETLLARATDGEYERRRERMFGIPCSEKGGVPQGAEHPAGGDDEKLVEEICGVFYGNTEDAREFVRRARVMQPVEITQMVNEWVKARKISEKSRKSRLYKPLHNHGIYPCALSNWNAQVK